MTRAVLSADIHWTCLKKRGYTVYHRGLDLPWSKLFAGAQAGDRKAITQILNAVNGHYAFIIEGKDFVFAAADHIASIPVFYTDHALGNDARVLQKHARCFDVNNPAVDEFLMTGYCTGADTAYQGLSRLQAGQGIILRAGKKPQLFSHFEYLPRRPQVSISAAQDRLGAVLDEVFGDLVRDLNGRTVLLPLSGGLDSRLVLTKLLEHGHRNIIAFSYGTRGNREAEIARDVAKALGVRWLHLPSMRAGRLAKTKEFKAFERHADGLSIVPSYLDYEALIDLKARDDIPQDAVIINGQTGDFIAGAHIPHELLGKEAGFDAAVQAIARVHYRQRDDMTPGLKAVAAQVQHLKRKPAYSVFEYWEWRERQAKAVMVGQRGYDFFGYDWRLPLWDKRLVDFFAAVPPALKKDRVLMRDYLSGYDPQGVFTKTYPEIGTWPKGRGGIQWIARGCGLIGGARLKDKCYDVLHYFSNYHNQFSLWGFGQYFRFKKYTKRFVGQSAIRWKNQNIDRNIYLVISKFLPEYTGAAFRISNLYKNRAVTVICNSTAKKESKTYKNNDFDVFRIVFSSQLDFLPDRLNVAIKTYGEFILSFIRLIGSKKPQLLHIVGYSGATMAALVYGRLFKVPRLVELVTRDATPFQCLPGLRYSDALKLDKQTAIVAISDQLKNKLRNDNLINNVWCRPNPIDGAVFSPVGAIQKAKLRTQISPFKKTDIVIAQVAKFMPQKNQIFMIEVLNTLPEAYKLILAGPRAETGLYKTRDDDYFKNIKALIKKYKLQDRVHIKTGFVPAADIMKASDLYVMPQYNEGLGTPMLEAMACGVPVVANAQEAAFQSWITDGQNGYLCAPNVKIWAAAIQKAHKIPQKQRAVFSEEIRDIASAEKIHAQYAMITDALIAMGSDEELDVNDVI